MQSHPKLREVSKAKWSKYIPHVPTPRQEAFLWLTCMDAFYGGAAGGGKVVSNDGVVLTSFGWKKGIDLKVGDRINNPDGSTQKIIQIKPEIHVDKWVVYFSDGTKTDVAKEHLWLSWKGRKGRKIKNKRTFGRDSAEVVETAELLEWIERGYSPQIPVCEEQPFNRTTKENNMIDPYLLGVLLGDGCTTGTNMSITCHEDDKPHYMEYFDGDDVNTISDKTIRFTGQRNIELKKKLTLHGLLGKKSLDKFIPEVYKYSSIETRHALVQGLMDTDGWSAKGKNACYYDTISTDLANDMSFILRSLGCVVTINKHEAGYKDDNGVKVICNDCYNLYIKAPDPDNLFRIERKKFGTFGKNLVQKSVIKVEVDGKITGRCITVSNPNGLYITNDFIVTHNSDALLMGALQYVDVPGYAAIIFRDTYANLSQPGALMDRAHEWLNNTDAHWNGSDKRWTFPSGATLTFGYMDGPKDHFNYDSAEYQYVAFDEAVNIRGHQAMFMFGRLRRPKGSNIPIRFRAASNPPTREQVDTGEWVKNRYVNPKTKEAESIFIPARLEDNPHVDQESYDKALSHLDPITRKQRREGDWEVAAEGEMFKREWFTVVPSIREEDIVDRVRYWDFAATEKKTADRTAGAKVVLDKHGNLFIQHMIKFRKSPLGVERIVRGTALADGKNTRIYIEEEGGASGKIAIDHYITNVLAGYPVYGVRPTGSKVERAMPVASRIENGTLKLVQGLWNADYIDECELFPVGKHDDQVDAVSGAIGQLAGNALPARLRIL